MEASEAQDYGLFKQAILHWLGITPEPYHLRFRKFHMEEGMSPRVAAQKLRHLCHRWLEPEDKSGPQVADHIVTEQLLEVMPRRVSAWVRWLQPKSTVEAVELTEAYQDAEAAGPAPSSKPKRDGAGIPSTTPR
ncbi:UNVERIFIED_CONTAM: hypothetical protein FKN15_049386 [Acipenser sinensis]